MLTECASSQTSGGPARRWFADEEFDLIVWVARDGSVHGFQLCYDRIAGTERALTWTSKAGYSHGRIDDGEASPAKNQTPIVVRDGTFRPDAILPSFAAAAATLDPSLRDFVLEKLRAYPGPR